MYGDYGRWVGRWRFEPNAGLSGQIYTGKDNPNRYVIATQSLDLRKKLRAVPGLPLVYINRSVMLLETPSDQTMQKKSRVSRQEWRNTHPAYGLNFLSCICQMENEKLHVSAAELALLNKTPATAPADGTTIIGGEPLAPSSISQDIAAGAQEGSSAAPPKKKKRKGPSGPNPLSVKKKAKPAATPNGASSKKRERSDDAGTGASTAEDRAERKRKRVAEEEVRVTSVASRAAPGSEREGDKARKKRKRSRKGKGAGASENGPEGDGQRGAGGDE